ncbi:UNVERIFIED_CONTAM: hypothetical protein Slati_3445000 [Sesamum latifolium]|uniref:Uncharacterized protein n=1 Tax=Sesamum latifolium TaxID=2727402 RepID=A0AAW2UJK1_9LAMI
MANPSPIESLSKEVWLLHEDSSATSPGNRTGVITSPEREDIESAVRFDFKASNNVSEYEALTMGIKWPGKLGLST